MGIEKGSYPPGSGYVSWEVRPLQVPSLKASLSYSASRQHTDSSPCILRNASEERPNDSSLTMGSTTIPIATQT